jgi:hypothetical protein
LNFGLKESVFEGCVCTLKEAEMFIANEMNCDMDYGARMG